MYSEQGKSAEAESLFKRSLKIDEIALGPEHPTVATTLNNLAILYKGQGKLDEAEPLLKRSLQITETSLGPAHQSVATSLHNLASLYQDQGQFAEAELLYKRALKIKESTFGTDHPKVATELRHLALLYEEQGSQWKAEPIYKRTLQILEKAVTAKRNLDIQREGLSGDESELAYSKRCFARILACQGKTADAELMMNDALNVLRKQPRSSEAKHATDGKALADIRYDAKRFLEASRLYDLVANAYERAFGPDDIRVAECQESSAKALRKLGREKEAAVREAEAAAIRKRAEK